MLTSYLPWLLLVARPLMVFVMTRRMGGGKNTDRDTADKITGDPRAARGRPTGSNPMNRRWMP